MKVSIITVVRNNKDTIKDAINSVINQTYKDIEYIIIDGASTDGTVEIVKSYGNKISKFVSEPDKGLYDAMNKGIKLATGDVVGILNSDDFYVDEFVIEKVVKIFEEKEVDSLFADIVFVQSDNLNKVIRYYDSSVFTPLTFAYGLAPAHPSFFVKREVYAQYGLFRTDLKIAADFDLMVRFLYKHKISYYYMQEAIIKMRMGGVSTSFSSMWLNTIENMRVCRDYGIKTNIFKMLYRYFHKVSGLFKKEVRD